jgi:hypothetical protein
MPKNKNWNKHYEKLRLDIEDAPVLTTKPIRVIDVMELLKAINRVNPKDLADVNTIILNQQQYEMTIIE